MMHLFRKYCLIGLMAALFAMPAVADIYQYRDAKGHVYLTDQPMPKQYRLIRHIPSPKPRRTFNGQGWQKRKQHYAPLIAAAAHANQLKPDLVDAVVRAESSYQADAVSHKGAMGLMQLMPKTAKELGVHNAFDPKQNLQGGARYLRQMLIKFNYDLRLALAAYNAGFTAVIDAGYRVPAYPETQQYVDKVLGFYYANQS